VRSSRQRAAARLASSVSPRERKNRSAPRYPTKLAKLSLNGVWLFRYRVLWASSWRTVATSSIVSRSTAVENSGSLK